MLLMKKETIEKYSNPAQRKKFFQEEQAKLDAQLATVRKDKDDAVKYIEGNKAKIEEYKKKIQPENEKFHLSAKSA